MSLIDAPPAYASSVRRTKSLGPSQRKPRQKKHVPDPIDKLDTTSFGGFYHHGGPYDAARPSFNINPKFSPIAATREGNRAAWEATPREAQLDALMRGRPLDGVGIVPPGHRAMNGQIMDYEEGADLMRDMDPGGGAYKRWPGIVCETTSPLSTPPPKANSHRILSVIPRLRRNWHDIDLSAAAIPPRRSQRQRRARIHHR